MPRISQAGHSASLRAGHRALEIWVCMPKQATAPARVQATEPWKYWFVCQRRPQRQLVCRPQSLTCSRHADSIFLPRRAPRVPKGGWSEFGRKTSALHNNLCLGVACFGQSDFPSCFGQSDTNQQGKAQISLRRPQKLRQHDVVRNFRCSF